MKIKKVIVTGSKAVGRHLCNRLPEIGIRIVTNNSIQNTLDVNNKDQLLT